MKEEGMIEVGKVMELNGDKMTVVIRRNTACGSCGQCHLGKENLNMVLTTDNTLGASVGDDVEIQLQTVNFFEATLIMYGIPLVAMLIGVLGGHFLYTRLGWFGTQSDVAAAITGILAIAISYMAIKANEKNFTKMKKFVPVVIRIL